MITFQKATLDDLDGILNVMIDTTYVQFFTKPYEVELKQDMESRDFFIAKDGDLIIAYAIFTQPQKRFKEAPIHLRKGYLVSSGVGVLTNYRGRGIAVELKQFSEAILKKRGVKGIYTDVASTNASSLRLQEKLGFTLLVEYETSYRPAGVKNCIFVKSFD